MSIKVMLAVADGSEDIETVTVSDVLRRAGIEVVLVSVMPQRQITCARGIQLRADALMADVMEQHWDAIVLPGGLPGAEHLADCAALIALLREQQAAGRLIGAICAAPALVLARHGLLKGYKATAFPGCEEALRQGGALQVLGDVVTDRRMVTSRGPATAMAFALQLVRLLASEQQADQVGKALLFFP